MDLIKRFTLLLAALVLMVGIAACGGGEKGGEETVSGSFELIAGAPAGYADLVGEARLTRSDTGTTTAIELTGLEPGSAYTAHLHSGGCGGAEPGGPHFKFDPEGSAQPPNEIHLELTADRNGSGRAKASSEREVAAGEAGSVVLHLADGQQRMTSLFVHEGHDHGDGSGEGVPEGGGESQEQPPSDEIACAELEGEASAATDGASAPVQTIEVVDGEPVGGIHELEFDAGEEIRFEVSADAAEEIHVHGYDVAENVPAGGSVEFAFPAEIEGIFEVELEAKGVQIAELRVNP